MKCPKCGYVRLSTDHAPEWQCPSCGVAYNKVKVNKQVKSKITKPIANLSLSTNYSWLLFILGGILLFIMTYSDSQDGRLYAGSSGVFYQSSQKVSLEQSPTLFYFLSVLYYGASLIAIAIGIRKYRQQKKK